MRAICALVGGRGSSLYPACQNMILAAQALVAEFLATFRDFPPRQEAASFTIDQALEKMADAASGAHR